MDAPVFPARVLADETEDGSPEVWIDRKGTRSVSRRNRLRAAWVVEAPLGLLVTPAKNTWQLAEYLDVDGPISILTWVGCAYRRHRNQFLVSTALGVFSSSIQRPIGRGARSRSQS